MDVQRARSEVESWLRAVAAPMAARVQPARHWAAVVPEDGPRFAPSPAGPAAPSTTVPGRPDRLFGGVDPGTAARPVSGVRPSAVSPEEPESADAAPRRNAEPARDAIADGTPGGWSDRRSDSGGYPWPAGSTDGGTAPAATSTPWSQEPDAMAAAIEDALAPLLRVPGGGNKPQVAGLLGPLTGTAESAVEGAGSGPAGNAGIGPGDATGILPAPGPAYHADLDPDLRPALTSVFGPAGSAVAVAGALPASSQTGWAIGQTGWAIGSAGTTTPPSAEPLTSTAEPLTSTAARALLPVAPDPLAVSDLADLIAGVLEDQARALGVLELEP